MQQKNYCTISVLSNLISLYFIIEANCGAGAQSVTVKPTGCGFDPHSRR